MSSSSLLLVVAAVIVDPEGRILLSQRPEGKNMAGYWEFPGGKVNRGELPEDALCRELTEELGIIIEGKDLRPLTFASHRYKRFHLLMPLYLCTQWQGVPRGCENQEIIWIHCSVFEKSIEKDYRILPTDLPLIPSVLKSVQLAEPLLFKRLP